LRAKKYSGLTEEIFVAERFATGLSTEARNRARNGWKDAVATPNLNYSKTYQWQQ